MPTSGYFRAGNAALLAAALLLGACNYGFRGGGGFPAHVRTVFIAPIENETVQFEVDQPLFRMLSEQLPRSLGVRVAGERAADAIVRTRVTGYEDVAQNYQRGQQGAVEVLANQVQIRLSIQIVDVRRNEILFESTGLTGRGEYRPDSQTQDAARTRAIELLIQQIIDGAQSQW